MIRNQCFLITGGVGFIGYHISNKLLKLGCKVVGYDNLNDYYDISLKLERLKRLNVYENYQFFKGDIKDYHTLEEIVMGNDITCVINLAAQAGVRYSSTRPETYIDSNVIGMFNVLEVCRKCNIKNLFYASSSSVYGNCKEKVFTEDISVDQPISLYAATKKSNELFAHVYSNNYKLNTIGLRFFTVYGPLGRPDMAYYSFTDKILKGETVDIYNYGYQYRDFTYIDDLVEGVVGLIYSYIESEKNGIYEVYNIGNGSPVQLMDFVNTLQDVIGVKAKINFKGRVVGDVDRTYANLDKIKNRINYSPNTNLKEGLTEFYLWYQEYQPEKGGNNDFTAETDGNNRLLFSAR